MYINQSILIKPFSKLFLKLARPPKKAHMIHVNKLIKIRDTYYQLLYLHNIVSLDGTPLTKKISKINTKILRLLPKSHRSHYQHTIALQEYSYTNPYFKTAFNHAQYYASLASSTQSNPSQYTSKAIQGYRTLYQIAVKIKQLSPHIPYIATQIKQLEHQ